MSIPGLIIAVALFTIGIIGTILPALPGAPLIWLGMFIYGLIVKFTNLPWTFYLGQGIAVIIISLLDYLAGVWGVRHYGGSKTAAWGSILGGLLGIIFLGPFGLIIGPFIGAVGGEIYQKQPLEKAFRVGFGTLLGFLGGTALKISIEMIMIIWFFIAIF